MGHFKLCKTVSREAPCPARATLPRHQNSLIFPHDLPHSAHRQRDLSRARTCPSGGAGLRALREGEAGTIPDFGSSGGIQHTPGICGGQACIGMTRDDADPTAFAQRIHSALTACGNPTGQWIRIVRPARA